MEVIKLFIIFFFSHINASPRSVKQYRTDYVFHSKSNAFYKLHIEATWHSRAESVCKVESATLMVPRSRADVAQLHGMMKQYPDIGDYAWVGNEGVTSAEEQPIMNLEQSYELTRKSNGGCNLMNRNGEPGTESCYNSFPFICKVEVKDTIFDSHCNVYGTGYKYYQSIGSCYKIPRIVYSWGQAYDECHAEGSHLVILNSEAERQIIYNLTNLTPAVDWAKTSWFFFAGIRARKTTHDVPRIFKTIFNETLEQAGFSAWSPGEPNNALNNEYCGTIFKNDGKYNDVDCSHQYAFICEKEIKLNQLS